MMAKLAAAALVASAAAAQTPPGWKLGTSETAPYELALDAQTVHSGKYSARVGCTARKCPKFTTLMQRVRADRLAGYRVRLSAWVKATKGGHPRIWMRADSHEGDILAFDNRDDLARKGPFDWMHQDIVLDIPSAAAILSFGLIVDGTATAWFDDVTLEVVSNRVDTTQPLRPPLPSRQPTEATRRAYDSAHREPQNLDFETPPQP